MFPPLSFNDISLMLSVNALILLAIVHIASPYMGHTNLTINKKKLRKTAIATSVTFLILIGFKILGLITGF
jgi:hypothetical protein